MGNYVLGLSWVFHKYFLMWSYTNAVALLCLPLIDQEAEA